MLNGITVIASWWVPYPILLLWILIGVIGVIVLWNACKKESWKISIIGLVLVGWAIFACFTPTFTPSEHRHKVLIDESVSLTDFDAKYEIIGYDGISILIRERTDKAALYLKQ